MNKQIVLLMSGGLDSYIAYHFLKQEEYSVYPLFVDYGGKYTNKELNILNAFSLPNFRVNKSIYLGNTEEQDGNAFIKNRNAYFALIASNYGNTICMAGLKDDNVGDKSPEAFRKMGNLLTEINGEEYTVFSPFWRMTKSEIIGWYCRNNLSMDSLLETTSCYHSTKQFCGGCPSCFRKWCAFNDNNIANYLPSFTNKKLVLGYIKNIKLYDKQRQKSMWGAAHKMRII